MTDEKEESEQRLSDAAHEIEREGNAFFDEITKGAIEYFRSLGYSEEQIRALLNKRK